MLICFFFTLQLQCIGGTASGRFAPKVVQCYNRGFDGLDVQWECQADLPSEYQFGRVRFLKQNNFIPSSI